MSLELVDGHIVFRFGFGGGVEVKMETVFTYNTNEWVRVNARRLGREGRLDVNQEAQEGTAPDIVDGKLELHDSQINFGGVPSILDTTKYVQGLLCHCT